MLSTARIAVLAAMTLCFAAGAEAQQTPVPSPPEPAVVLPPFAGPAVSAQARIYVYRDFDSYTHLTWTSVSLNGTKIGDSAPGSYFYRDVPPGIYTVSVNSDLPYVDQSRTITIAPNSTTFIKVYAAQGFGVSTVVAAGRHAAVGTAATVPSVFGNAVIDAGTARQQMARLSPAG
jgi:Protein of unknown function (DUF2846)